MNGLRLLLITLLLPTTSCVAVRNLFRKKPDTAEAKPEAPRPTTIGIIEAVNPDAKFVIVHLNANSLVPVGTELTSLDAAGQSAKLKVTPERKSIFISADIISGTPQKGDSVIQGAAPAKAIDAPQMIMNGDQGRPTISISPAAMLPESAPVAPAEFLRPVPSTQ